MLVHFIQSHRFGFPVLSDGFLLWLDIGQIPPLARYLRWPDTSFGQISPLAHLARYLIWLDISVGQIPDLARYLHWPDTSFGQISPLARYLLWLDISVGQIPPLAISPLARYLIWLDTFFNMASPLRQHISYGNILFFFICSDPTKQFPFLWTDCFLDCPTYHCGELENFFILSLRELMRN